MSFQVVLMENEELKHNKAINMVELAINGNVFTQQRSQGMAAWLNRMAPNQVAAGQQKGHGQLNCWGHSATCQVRDGSPMVSIGT
jgi:hypothetical protein